jgi:hypothetical protein
MSENKYRLDRNEAKALSFDEANNHIQYWSDKTPDERLNAACFIINQIFSVTPETKVDRSITDKRKFS